MFIVSNELFVSVESREDFERHFAASMHGTLTDVPGLLTARLMRPLETERGYLSVLEFTDEAAYSAFRGSEAFAAAHNWPDHAPIDHARLTTYEVHTEITAPNLS